MTQLTRQIDAFDILFKNFFKADSLFEPVLYSQTINHPVDIYEDVNGLHFEIACTGLSKEDVSISIEDEIIRIGYDKPIANSSTNVNISPNFLHKGIAKRSFNLGYRVSGKFNLTNAIAEMKNGLLKIDVPFAETSKPKTLSIN